MSLSNDTQMRAHLDIAMVENARFLLGLGEHIDRVARRLGVTRDALEKAMDRHK